jgi:Nucleotide-diphospho-sugar transferase
MIAPFRVLTCADADYFHFLPFFEANVERKFGALPLIYDLGLTPEQRASLRAPVLGIEIPADYKDHEPTRGYVMTTHKPACIAHALDHSPGGVLYADADVLFAAPVTPADLGSADVAVTPRTARERQPKYLENGALNAGVLWFANTPEARRLLSDWTEACDEGDRTDQKALSDLLAAFDLLGGLGPVTRDDLTVLRLDAREFNDVRLKTGRVLHFKNAGRDPLVTAKLERARRLEERHPRLLAAGLALRRKLGV